MLKVAVPELEEGRTKRRADLRVRAGVDHETRRAGTGRERRIEARDRGRDQEPAVAEGNVLSGEAVEEDPELSRREAVGRERQAGESRVGRRNDRAGDEGAGPDAVR